MESNITTLNPLTVSRKEFDDAVTKVKEHLTEQSNIRAAHEQSLEKRQQIVDMNMITIKTALNFVELVNRELFGPRPRMIQPEEERQGRMSATLNAEDLERIHFHNTRWWFWSKGGQSRIGPYDTSELAAEGLVSYERHLKDARS